MTSPITDPRTWGLYVITDRTQTLGRSLEEVVRASIQGGARVFQLREKDLEARELTALAERLLQLITPARGFLLINDRIDVALATGADGAHLSQRGLPPAVARRLLGPTRLLGVSCHSLAEAEEAHQGGADFILLGPIFYTPSKASYGPPVGLELLREVRPNIRLPIFAIGGITAARRTEILAAGADGVAVISAV
ncbi:MAG TPA: thiamine phosphate synthase, partial [Candidatus Methylomirabilis sp.]|nr:thiamine phosphate synthase [Candidatus Methylomirabilis sp.]